MTSSIAAAVAGPGGAGRREAFAFAVMASTSAEGEAGRSPSADGNGIVEDVEADPGAGLIVAVDPVLGVGLGSRGLTCCAGSGPA